jgi:uncharacterized protein YbjT (DUF2867 family)
MKILIIGGTGRIGSNVATRLRGLGHEVVAAAPSTGVNAVTGEGVSAAMREVDVVVDVPNSPSFEASAVMEFFTKSTRNLLAAEKAAGVKHHVALSIVGTERLENDYFKAKLAQEKLIKEGDTPYTIVHATQFMEFIGAIADTATTGDEVRVSTGYVQLIAANDVAEVLADVALAPPTNGHIDIAGPDRVRMSEMVSTYLNAVGDARKVKADPDAPYFGSRIADDSLVPLGEARLGPTTFSQWFNTRGAA